MAILVPNKFYIRFGWNIRLTSKWFQGIAKWNVNNYSSNCSEIVFISLTALLQWVYLSMCCKPHTPILHEISHATQDAMMNHLVHRCEIPSLQPSFGGWKSQSDNLHPGGFCTGRLCMRGASTGNFVPFNMSLQIFFFTLLWVPNMFASL